MARKVRVVVTGVGPLCSIGTGKDELWESIKSEKTRLVKKDFYSGDDLLDSFFLHEIENFNIGKFGIDPELLVWIRDWKKGVEDKDLEFLTAVSKLALDDSGLKYDPAANDVGLVITHENPGLENFFDSSLNGAYDFLRKNKDISRAEFIRGVYEKVERQGYDTQTFMYLFFLSKIFSTHGFSLFVNNACASGLYAIETAAQLVRDEKCSAVIVAGADRQTHIYKHWWLKSLGLYASDGLIKPYSQNRNGFVMGEGGGALILESLDHAEKRGARIYGEYLGGAFNLEGGRVSLPSVEKDYYAACIKNSLESTGTHGDQVDLVCPHAIGTNVTDLHEARALSKVFKSSDRYAVSAFKPYFGHNLGSCALLELSLMLTAMEHDYVPRVLNAEPADPRIKLPIAFKALSRPIKTALKLACGFAGYNGAAVFKKI